MPQLKDIPYPSLSNDSGEAVQMLGAIMGIEKHLISSVDPDDLAPVLSGLFYYRFLPQAERNHVLQLAHQLSNRPLFAVIQRKAADILVNKDWELWSQSAQELMDSEEFNQTILKWLQGFGFGVTYLAGHDIVKSLKTATSKNTRSTVAGKTARRFVLFYVLGTAIALASSERQQQLNQELERRKKLFTSAFYK
ncbi:MAG: hypothetical protein MI864_19470 [Pseudomonadales bacterium]|nr:hypothetical protein [Pseudomonadales bacterium]